MPKLSLTYRFLRLVGLNYPEDEYGDVSLFKVITRFFSHLKNAFLMKYFMNIALLAPINHRKVRPTVLKWLGCTVGENV